MDDLPDHLVRNINEYVSIFKPGQAEYLYNLCKLNNNFLTIPRKVNGTDLYLIFRANRSGKRDFGGEITIWVDEISTGYLLLKRKIKNFDEFVEHMEKGMEFLKYYVPCEHCAIRKARHGPLCWWCDFTEKFTPDHEMFQEQL
tara:strand:+ start:208 stop:636 length:429 start_codon:yes stop_codon:yes gene_type:complete